MKPLSIGQKVNYVAAPDKPDGKVGVKSATIIEVVSQATEKAPATALLDIDGGKDVPSGHHTALASYSDDHSVANSFYVDGDDAPPAKPQPVAAAPAKTATA